MAAGVPTPDSWGKLCGRVFGGWRMVGVEVETYLEDGGFDMDRGTKK
jgi:hypothetical protein